MMILERKNLKTDSPEKDKCENADSGKGKSGKGRR